MSGFSKNPNFWRKIKNSGEMSGFSKNQNFEKWIFGKSKFWKNIQIFEVS
jgi:hypothetical protein